MKPRRASLRPFVLPLVRPLGTAHGPISSRRGWLVELENDEGLVGYGEATPLPEFGTEDLASCRRALEAGLREWIATPDASAPELPWRSIGPIAGTLEAPCASSAIDAARYDLAARLQGASLAAALRRSAGLGGEPAREVAVQALVSGDDPTGVTRHARIARAAGFEAFKLKLAVSPDATDVGLDVERVAALREVVGPTARVRLDANEAWTREQAARALALLERFGIEFVEQPVHRDDLASLKALSTDAAIAVAADEAIQGEGLRRCLEARAASILVAKPAVLGGPSAAIRLAAQAREEGLRVVWSTLIDGAVGRALPLALAAGLGGEGEVHGLGTAGLLACDLAEESIVEQVGPGGRIALRSGAGVGFDPRLPSAPTADCVPAEASPADDWNATHFEIEA